MRFIVLDSGALIAIERGSRRLQALLERVRGRRGKVLVPAGVVAEIWRDGRRQARVAKLLGATETRVVELDETRARAVGALLAVRGGDDVVDGSVVLCAREHGDSVVVTCDPQDLRSLDPALSLLSI